MYRFNPFHYKNLFNSRVLFLTTVPIMVYSNFEKRFSCGWFGTKYYRNKLANRISTIQYNANNPIEDRISYKDFDNVDGYAALVLDGHGGWQIVFV